MKAAECFCGSHFWFHLISWGWANIQFLAQWCALNQSAVWASWAAWLAWKTERSTVRHLRRMMLGQEIVTPGKEAIWRHRETESQYRMYQNHQTKFPFDNIEAEGEKKFGRLNFMPCQGGWWCAANFHVKIDDAEVQSLGFVQYVFLFTMLHHAFAMELLSFMASVYHKGKLAYVLSCGVFPIQSLVLLRRNI